MGTSQSFQKLQTFLSCHILIKKQQKQLLFGSQIQIYKSKFNPKQQYIMHTIRFDDYKQMENMIKQIRQMTKNKSTQSPFNILYPLNIYLKQQENFPLLPHIANSCSKESFEVVMIHKNLPKTLFEYVKQKYITLQLFQSTIWFIINQISKSLQMLEQKNHWNGNLIPQNIFCNHNQNWYIYDGYYVVGGCSENNIDQFSKQKLKTKSFLSQQLKKKIEANIIITSYDLMQEDVYCFGYCIIYIMTGIQPHQMPGRQKQREKYVHQLLDAMQQDSLEEQQCQQSSKAPKYSAQIITFVKNLIKADPRRRFSIRHIRSVLKSKQQEIFMNQQLQWSNITPNNKKINEQSSSKLTYNNDNTVSRMRKLNKLKSQEKPVYKKRTVTEFKEENQSYNMTSMKTLKKQPMNQRLVMMNERHIPKPLTLAQNDISRYRSPESGQMTPIRMISQNSTRQNIITARFPQKMQKFQHIHNNHYNLRQGRQGTYQNSNNIRAMNAFNSPRKQQNFHVTFVSPQKFSSNNVQVPIINALKQQGQAMPHYMRQVPPKIFLHPQSSPYISNNQHSNNSKFQHQSPSKIKMSYFSPSK